MLTEVRSVLMASHWDKRCTSMASRTQCTKQVAQVQIILHAMNVNGIMLQAADSTFPGHAGRRPPYPGGMPSFQEEQGSRDGALGSYSSSAYQAEQAGSRGLASYKSGGYQQEQPGGGPLNTYKSGGFQPEQTGGGGGLGMYKSGDFQQEPAGGGGGLGPYKGAAFQQELGDPFGGSFPRPKETSMAPPEHQWSLSSA